MGSLWRLFSPVQYFQTLKGCPNNIQRCSTLASSVKKDVKKFSFPKTQSDLKYLLNPQNRPKIVENLVKRLEIQILEAERQLDELQQLAEVFCGIRGQSQAF
jgi:hypothetical protein